MDHATDQLVEHAVCFLRGHTTADLRFDENLRPIKYVISADGMLVAPAMVAMLKAVDTVLFIPEFIDGAMEVQVTLHEIDERGAGAAAADRWRIYHGEPQDVRWALLSIDGARFEGSVIDDTAISLVNPLAAHEARICREMNQGHADDLKRLCERYAKFAVENPVMVGIDPGGIDVRAAFDVVRVRATTPLTSEDSAMRTLTMMAQRTQ